MTNALAKVQTRKRGKAEALREGDALWYKDAVIYELHVRAFADSDGDGIGDFKGLTSRLDYLQDLGVTAIWLLPFYPSPLKDDGYDISDYFGVHPNYGTLPDVRQFLREAHRRGLRVVTELVMNHTSDQHAWFKRARKAPPGSAYRDFYVWNDSTEKYKDARIIFKDYETSNWAWDPVAKAYYWHRFYSSQPDLNFDNPKVQKAMLQAVDFWYNLGIDGLRLDAVPYLYEREGTSCENLPETHEFLKKLRRHVDTKFKNRMLLAEANQWPEDAVSYFGQGDECHMAFHFPIMPRMFMALHMEDRYPIIDILQQTPAIPDTAQWATFLRNHDELTLEMVTDEERDYMYRVYAHDHQARINLGIRRRLSPLLRGHRRKIELMNGLLLALPGTPVIYYGDEIGMGDNIYLGDRNGVRTPMQWSADRNAGFSSANPQRLYLPVIIDPENHYETVNVEAQQNNPHSLLWWMKRLLALRKRFKAFSRGSIEFLQPDNRRILAFVRRWENEVILVVANLSRFVEYAEFDLSPFKGMVPVEMFGRRKFPSIKEGPYFLSLAPHAFYWFTLEPQKISGAPTAPEEKIPALSVSGEWENVFSSTAAAQVEEILPAYLQGRRWFAGKSKQISAVRIAENIKLVIGRETVLLLFIHVEYNESQPETYALPVTFATGEKKDKIIQGLRSTVLSHLRVRSGGEEVHGILYDALADKEFGEALLDSVARGRRVRGGKGELVAMKTSAFRALRGLPEANIAANPMKADQSNTSLMFGDRFILKLFRRLEQGMNPDLEMGRFLTDKTTFAHTPPVAGFIEYRKRREEPMILGILQGFVPNQGNAWQYTLDEVERYFERVLAGPAKEPPALPARLFKLIGEEPPELVREMISSYLESARLLGQRTAELHIALASAPEDPAFAPEPFTPHFQRALYQSMRNLTAGVFQTLAKAARVSASDEVKEAAHKAKGLEPRVLKFFQTVMDKKIHAMRIRCHGDFHLGQVLYTGKDFVVIDFEGEPTRSLSERKLKRPPLRDVASMLRSFDYAAYTAVFRQQARGVFQPDMLPLVKSWAGYWQAWVCSAFLKSYLRFQPQMPFLPANPADQELLLNVYLLEKMIYEIGYELDNRPDWARIPLYGLFQFMENIA